MALARILVVEDDEKLNHIVCAYLSGVGYQATGCLNGEEALKKLEEAKYDMIVTDIMMPKADGFRLAEEVRSSDKQIPILFMTARNYYGKIRIFYLHFSGKILIWRYDYIARLRKITSIGKFTAFFY